MTTAPTPHEDTVSAAGPSSQPDSMSSQTSGTRPFNQANALAPGSQYHNHSSTYGPHSTHHNPIFTGPGAFILAPPTSTTSTPIGCWTISHIRFLDPTTQQPIPHPTPIRRSPRNTKCEPLKTPSSIAFRVQIGNTLSRTLGVCPRTRRNGAISFAAAERRSQRTRRNGFQDPSGGGGNLERLGGAVEGRVSRIFVEGTQGTGSLSAPGKRLRECSCTSCLLGSCRFSLMSSVCSQDEEIAVFCFRFPARR
ncbi:hypothetical protein FA13DRAFT_1459462 [Coprinellus micaceus]|uniref:Uncharacterized protein n=1 Tax=Coprinellus micaceus TaxID=71717 RepID=A0A4Y7SMK0_COPMI|nr:hypothetical protein FA13DRAFT_1459462 [Coprinellus micaceus]